MCIILLENRTNRIPGSRVSVRATGGRRPEAFVRGTCVALDRSLLLRANLFKYSFITGICGLSSLVFCFLLFSVSAENYSDTTHF